MASLVANIAKAGLMSGAIDLDTNTIKAALLNTTTTADTDPDSDTVAGYVTLGRVTGTTDQTLGSPAVATNDTDNRGEFDAADITFTAVPTGETAQGVLVYKFVTNDAGSTPIAFIEFPATVPTNGGNIVVSWSANGLLHLT